MNRKTLIVILTVGFCLGAAPAWAGPLATSEISADANWIVHIDHETFLRSSIGRLVRTEMNAQNAEEQLQSFATIFGFHPLDDVRDATLYGTGQDRKKAVVLIDGKFDQDKLLALVRMNAQHAEFTHNGVTIHRWLHEEKKEQEPTSQMMYGCLYDEHLVVMSADLDTTRRAIDTVRNDAGGVSAELLGPASSNRDETFFQVVATGVGAMAGDEPRAALLRQTEALRLHAGETNGKVFMTIALQGTSQEVAQNVSKMADGMIAMATLAGKEQPALAELVRNIQLSTDDKTTHVHFEAPAQSVFDFLRKQWQQKKQQPESTS